MKKLKRKSIHGNLSGELLWVSLGSTYGGWPPSRRSHSHLSDSYAILMKHI